MYRRLFNWSHVFVALLSLLIIWVCSFIALNISFFDPVHRALQNFSLSDVYYQVLQESGREEESPLITIVDVTTLYDRGRIAQTIDDINACEPAVLGIDIMFEGLRGDTLGSERLVEAVCQTADPVLAFKLKDADPETAEFLSARHSFFAPIDGLQEGYTNVQHIDLGGIIRNMSTWHLLQGDTVHSLSYHLAHHFSPDVSMETLPQRQLIDYTPTRFPVVPYDSVLHYREKIANRIVLLGAMNDDADMHYSPYGRTAGTCIQAYAVQTLLEHHHIVEVNFFWTLLLSFIVIVLADIIQCGITALSKRSKHAVIHFLFESALVKNIISFILMAFLMWLNFILFTQMNVYFNPTIMLVGITLVVETRLLYDSAIITYKNAREERQQTQVSTQP